MTKHTPAETSEWVAGNLRNAEGVSKVEVLSDQVLRVSRTKYDPFVAGIVSAKCVEVDTVRPLVNGKLCVEIIANVPKESYWTGGALRLAHDNNIVTGCYGDLLRVIDLQDVRAFQQAETEFVERCLRQHDRVSSFERVHDRLYRISRNGLPDLTVAMLNEYELTADHLRTARDRYGQFSVGRHHEPERSRYEFCRGSRSDSGRGNPEVGALPRAPKQEMTEAPEEIAVRALYEEMQRIKARVPTSRWFLFGSITTTKRPVGDIDLLVVCKINADCTTVRAELAPISAQFPIHLLVMTPSEEAEVKFIHTESAVEITSARPFQPRRKRHRHEEDEERLEGRRGRRLSLSADRCEDQGAW